MSASATEAPPALENAERPEWLPANFKSPEDLAASYKQAQAKISEQGVELADLREGSGLADALTQVEALEAENARLRTLVEQAPPLPGHSLEAELGRLRQAVEALHQRPPKRRGWFGRSKAETTAELVRAAVREEITQALAFDERLAEQQGRLAALGFGDVKESR